MRIFSFLFLGVLLLGSLVATLFLSTEPNLDLVLNSPNWQHWLGTDSLGRDVLLRVLQGNFLSWAVGATATFLACLLGVFFGFWAGWKAGGWDFLLMRMIELIESIPTIVLVTLMVLFLRPFMIEAGAFRFLTLALAMGLVSWMNFARLVRVLVLQESQSAFVEGAQAIGATPARILRVHLWPHLWPHLRQSLWSQLPFFFIFESSLSFLGFGLQPPEISLGLLLHEGWRSFSAAPHLLLAPGILLFLTLLCFQIAAREESKEESLARYD